MSWPRSVRARLALWHGLALLVVVSVYAAAVLIQVRDDLYEALDAQLDGDQALAVQWLEQDLSGAAASRATRSRPRARTRQAPRGNDFVWVDVWTSDGQRVARPRTRPALPAPPGPPSAWPRRPTPLRLPDGDRVRTLVRPASVAGRALYVRVGRSERFARQELEEFAAVLGLSLPFAFAVAAGAGYLLARRALAPVSAMTARARRITADHLEERLPVENPADEFGQLAVVINDALARLERAFDTLRRFTADASHELRTPLTAIRSVGEVGLRERRSEAEYREMIGSILEETERLTTMTDSLLLLSRADAGRADLRPSAVDLADLAREVAADLDVLAEEKRQQLRVATDRGGATSSPTGRRCARRCSTCSTTRSSTARRRRPSSSWCAGPATTPSWRSSTTARGSRPSTCPTSSNGSTAPTRRGRGASGGAGLGLAIAQWAVEANGGRIEVESETRRGSAFRIVLPAPESGGIVNQHSRRTS